MGTLQTLYRPAFGLMTDLYQVTMAAGYWQSGMADREAVFHVAFRKAPFGGRFAVACGLADAVEFITNYRFADEDIEYLSTLTGARRLPLFEPAFLDFLSRLRFRGDVDAVREGTVVFPHEPLLRVAGPLLECQLLETALLTIVNFQTLIATKSARVCRSAGDDPVLEFGLRRAQGLDGGMSAARAAVVGGCAGTSNVLAGRLYDVPVRGTHAHSWVMSFDEELVAFQKYAEAMPDNCIFLVDTYDTLNGVRRAIEVAKGLRDAGHEMIGVRLDSGDLAELSRGARRLLDDAGFPNAKIVASGDLDEYEIARLRESGAPIDVWGVGTRLATSYDQPALGGVYKLAALRDEQGDWTDRLKLSDEPAKTSTPGIHQVRRMTAADGSWLGDVIYDARDGLDHVAGNPIGVWSIDAANRIMIEQADGGFDLLHPIVRRGEVVAAFPTVVESRAHVREQWAKVPAEVVRFQNPAAYAVGLSDELAERKRTAAARATAG